MLDKERNLNIEKLTLTPSGGGRFEITADGREIWSKKATKRFPELEELLEGLSSRV